MGKFLPGLFIGAAIGLLIAPKKGEEMRLELAGRWQQLQNKISGSESSAMRTSTTNDEADPITLPVDALESARPTSSPMSTGSTPASTFGRTSAGSVASTTTTMTPPVSTTASIPTTTSPKQDRYYALDEDDKSAPITTPVETFEEVTPNTDTASLKSETTNTTTSKLDTPYQNPSKSNTASRWLNNGNQHRRG